MAYPTYGYNYGYNPAMFQQQQQRLAEYEQQYPQFSNPNNGINPINQNQLNNQMNNGQMGTSQNFVKCRAVTSIDEAKASMIDLDGSIHVFTDLGNKKIYTKQINLDGTATLNIYNLQESPDKTPQETPASTEIPYVKQEELEAVCRSFSQQIDELEDRIMAYERVFAKLQEEPASTAKTSSRNGGKK